jgi:undecaprenyl-diphosphatase
MTVWEAIALGIVQGLTEFFPVSSSGHLVLAEALLGVNPPGVSFEVLVHLATLMSVLAVYGRRVLTLLVDAARGRRDAWSYLGMLVLATLPIGIAGISLAEPISRVFDLPIIAAGSLLVTGAVVYATRWLVQYGERDDPGWWGSLVVGLAQAIALLPGISRSGFTVAAALRARTRPERAAEFSFLLSVPAILGAASLSIPELSASVGSPAVAAMVAAVLSAFLAGMAAIVFFIRWLRGGRFHLFAYYCWIVGGIYILYSLIVAP